MMAKRSMSMLVLNGYDLSAQAVAAAVRDGTPIALDGTQLEKVARSRQFLDRLLTKGSRFTALTPDLAN